MYVHMWTPQIYPYIDASNLPLHMNIHLAKLHIPSFLRAIYGFEVKVFHNISGVETTNSTVNWKFTCTVALAQVYYAHGISVSTYNEIPLICGCGFFGCVQAPALCTSDQFTQRNRIQFQPGQPRY